MSHLVIIDGHHLMYRAYWAIPRGLQSRNGEQLNAVFGVAGMIMQILKTEQPDALLFCFDAAEENFRAKEYREYKAGRAETPDDFYTQIPRIFEMVETFGFKSVAGNGFEADDFACAYARAAERRGDRVTVISGDRDLLQLASDRVRMAVPTKGYQQPEYYGPEQIVAKYGVTPEQIPSYKGLVGDPSDNLKGVNGIGPKAATALLQQYGTIDEIYAHLSEIKSSWRQKLLAGREQAAFCKRMSELVCDMPLPVPLEELAIASVDSPRILALFHSLEFFTLGKRFMTFVSTPYGKAHFAPLGSEQGSEDQLCSVARVRTDESSQLSLL